MLPKAVRDLTSELTALPGIGPKTAQRLALHILRQPRSVINRLAETLKNLHANVRICTVCYNLAEDTTCSICKSEMRDSTLLCVVEDALDVEAIEQTHAYRGLYHVLGGVLSPVDGVGPDQLTLAELVVRLKQEPVRELIIALDHTMESDATARYIAKQILHDDITVTRLARGLPTGGDIEFADAVTLTAALQGRKSVAA